MITKEEVQQLFSDHRAKYLAVICGEISGGLEIIDVDLKYDLTLTLWDDYFGLIENNDPTLAAVLKKVKTRGNGRHIYYRCETISKNKELAQRYTTDDERKEPMDKIRVLIETRGEGGYAIAPPSDGYEYLDALDIPTITPKQRDLIWEAAKHFNEVIEKPVTNHTTQGYIPKEYGKSPFDDYNERGSLEGGKENIFTILKRHGWEHVKNAGTRTVYRRPGKDEGTSGNYWPDKKWFSVFTTSTQFQAQKAYLPYAVYCILECNGDYKLCAKKLLKEGYGEEREYIKNLDQSLWQKKRGGATKQEMVAFVKEQRPKDADNAEHVVDDIEKAWGETLCTFWDVDDKMKVSINRTKLIDFLYKVGGFSLYYYDKASTIFKIVRCNDGFLEEVSSEHIKKFLKNYIESLPDLFDGGVMAVNLMELVLKGSETFFSKSILEFLNRGNFDFLKDTATEAFLPFKNGVAVITKESIELKHYNQIGKVIWASQVIPFDIVIDKELDNEQIEYAEFLNCVSGQDDDRFNYACSLVGYLLHKHKDFAKPYSVILAEENDNENEGGGTGKSIFVTALSKFVKAERIDGKTFKLDKNFAFQRVGLDTKLVAIEDCRKNVDFEGFYSIITEGMTVEKKNKDELFIPYSDSPKILFTTNYTISSQGNHAKRRQRVFEFSNFFNSERTPRTHFGHNLFDEWDRDEWNRFYNFGFLCIQYYLQSGVLTVKQTDKIKRKHIRLKYGPEFLDWWDDYVQNGRKNWKLASDLYGSFLTQFDIEKKDYAQQKFGRALSETCEILSLVLKKDKNRQNGNKIIICVLDPGEVIKENVDLFGDN